MNIFGLDEDPKKCAQYLCDMHVKRVALEMGQVLSTVAFELGYKNPPYHPTFRDHKCVIWAGASIDNWEWLIEYGTAIHMEYMKRYRKIHGSHKAHLWAKELTVTREEFQYDGLLPFADSVFPRAQMIWTSVEQSVDEYRDFYGRKEARWHQYARVYALMNVAMGNKYSPGNKPKMRWNHGTRRPDWMPQPSPVIMNGIPARQAALLWGQSHPNFDKKKPDEGVLDAFLHLDERHCFPAGFE